MKLFVRLVSLILTAGIALGTMFLCDTHAAAANSPNYTVTVGYEEYVNGKGKGNYVVELSNISKEEFMYLKGKFDSWGGNLNVFITFENDVTLRDFSVYDMFGDIDFSEYGSFSVLEPMPSIILGSESYDKTKLSCSFSGNSVKFVLDPNDLICAKAIKKIKASSKCYISLGLFSDAYYEYYSGNWSSYEVKNKGNEAEETAEEIKETAEEIKEPAKGKESEGNYSVNGYYSSDKSKYCVEVSGITKKEYQYLWDCYNYYNKLDEIEKSTIKKRRIVIKLAQYGRLSNIELHTDIVNNLFYLYKGTSAGDNSFWKTTSKELTGDLIDNGDTYSYVFYIDVNTDKGKQVAKILTTEDYYETPSVDIRCTEELADPEIEIDGGKTMFHAYCYYTKAWTDAETANYTKNTGSVKGSVVKASSAASSQKKISTLSISSISNKTYSGKAKTPDVKIKDGDYTLKKGTDYTLSYKNNKNIGKATVTITGKGKYSGTKTVSFKIVPKKTTINIEKVFDAKAKITWKSIDGAEKYQIYYSTDGKKYEKIAVASANKTSYTISKLDFKKYDYKFKIRSYVLKNGKKYYSDFSEPKTVK